MDMPPGGFGAGIFDDDPNPPTAREAHTEPTESAQQETSHSPATPRSIEHAPSAEPQKAETQHFDAAPDDGGLFGGVVPIDESYDAKAAALRRQRQESMENRGVEALDDRVHGAEIPPVDMEGRPIDDRNMQDKRGRRQGSRRDRGDRGDRGGRGRDRGRRGGRDRGDAPRMQHEPGGGFGGEFEGKPTFGRPLPGPSYDQSGAGTLIESPGGAPPMGAPPIGAPGGMTGGMSGGGPVGAPPGGFRPSGYSGGGDVSTLRREIEDLRAQLQRSYTGGSSAPSAYGEGTARPMSMGGAAPTSGASPFTVQRVAILADVPSLQRTSKKIFGRVLSYSKVLLAALRGRGAVRAIAFLAERDASDAAFVNHLRTTGFEIRRIEMSGEGFRRADAGGSLAIEASRLANRVDAIVIASNDVEVLNLLPALRAQGCRTELMGFPEAVAEPTRDAADGFTALTRDELI